MLLDLLKVAQFYYALLARMFRIQLHVVLGVYFFILSTYKYIIDYVTCLNHSAFIFLVFNIFV